MRLKTNVVTKLVLLLNLALLLTFSPAAASETADWRMVLYNPIDHSLFALTQDGITETWALPPDTVFVALSPSEEFAVLRERQNNSFESETMSAESIFLFNLETGECCDPLVTQETFAGQENYEGDTINLYGGGFNETGTLFAFDFMPIPPDAGESMYFMPVSKVGVVNVETLELVGVYPYGYNVRFAFWDGDEVVLHPRPTSLPGEIPSFYEVFTMDSWNPETGETGSSGLTTTILMMDSWDIYDIGEILVTGEHISASFVNLENTSFVFRSIAYHQNGQAQMIWFDMHERGGYAIKDETARWISDGRYIFNRVGYDERMPNTNRNLVQILSRDGTIDEIEIPAWESFLAGTPNGWLAGKQEDGSSVIVEYVYDGGLIETREIVTFSAGREMFPFTRVIKPMSLGASLTDPQSFPQVQPPMLGPG